MINKAFTRRDVVGLGAVLAAAGAPSLLAAEADTEVWEIGPPGGFDTLRRVSRVTPLPGPGQVRVSVTHSAIAARDQAIVQGWFLEDKPATLIPLSEGVGRISAVGAGVAGLEIGQRVTCCHFAEWRDGAWTPANYRTDVGNTVDGWLGREVLLPASGIVVLPETVSDSTAATLSGSGVTAWHALHEVGGVGPGDTVLSLGTGGVSSWGLLLAKAAGARVAVTSSSDTKLARMRELGADVTVNYRTKPDWGAEVLKQTGGATLVLENVGRATLDQSMNACASNAMIVMIGTGPLPAQLPKMPGFYVKNLALKAISNGSRAMLQRLAQRVAERGITAEIGGQFAFADVVAAFEYARASGHVGKVLLQHT